jgi:hypothetical protein
MGAVPCWEIGRDPSKVQITIRAGCGEYQSHTRFEDKSRGTTCGGIWGLKDAL